MNRGEILSHVANDYIDNYYPIFLAFDVVDGKMTKKEYFREVKKHD